METCPSSDKLCFLRRSLSGLVDFLERTGAGRTSAHGVVFSVLGARRIEFAISHGVHIIFVGFTLSGSKAVLAMASNTFCV